jgi:hypothetical protein
MERPDPDTTEFVIQLQKLEKPLQGFNATLRAINQWESDRRSAIDAIRNAGQPAAAALYNYLLARPSSWAKSATEFIIGYEPDQPDLISPTESAKLADWYACIAEAFDLSAAPTDMDMTPEAADDFQLRFAALVDKVARILVPLERHWTKLNEKGA